MRNHDSNRQKRAGPTSRIDSTALTAELVRSETGDIYIKYHFDGQTYDSVEALPLESHRLVSLCHLNAFK